MIQSNRHFDNFGLVIVSVRERCKVLTGMQSKVMELRKLHLSIKEIAELLHLSTASVKQRITRARRRMMPEPKNYARIENMGNRAA